MRYQKEELRHLAELARIEIDPKEEDKIDQRSR